MATTNFIPGTVIASTWLNDVDDAVYRKLAEWVSITDSGGVGDGVTDNAAILTALLAAGHSRIYIPEGVFAISTPISATLTANLVLEGEGTLKFSGASNTNMFVSITLNGFNLQVKGLTFDGNSLIAGGLKIENTTAMADSLPVCDIRKNTFKSFRMNTTSIWNVAVYVAGSMTQVSVEDNIVLNITRAAGTGTPGVNGTTGIYVTQTDATHYVRSCVHRGNFYTNISGDDLVGSANNVDFDAFKYYTSDPTSNDNVDATVSSYFPGTCWSTKNTYRNVRGRAIKVQALANVTNEKIIRDADYTLFGGSTEINLQYGAGVVRDIEFFYKDYAGPTSPIQTSGHTLVSFFQGAWYDEAHGGSSVSGIRVYNNIKAGVGSPISQIVNAQATGTALGVDRSLIKVSDVVVNRGDVGWIVTLSGDTGADCLVVLDDIEVSKLLYSAIGTAYTNPAVKVVAKAVYNMDGVVTPGNAVKFVSDTGTPGANITFLGSLSGHSCYGFLNTFNRGADFTSAPLLVDGALTGTGLGGAASVQTVSLADDASHTFERRFYNSSRGLIFVSVNFDYTTQGVFACGSNGVYQIAAHASDLFTPSTSGSNTDTDGQLNLWFTGGALNIKNRLGGTYVVTVMFVG